MFVQVDKSLERSQGGLGIGLSLVKRLVGMHAGSVEAFSRGAGLGAEFVVRLPLAKDIAHAPRPVSAEAKSALAPRTQRVLVVDDNHDSATTLALLLNLMGHETRTANDGIEALEVAERFKPDVALLDIGMPRLNGYETARKMRDSRLRPRHVARGAERLGTGRRPAEIQRSGLRPAPRQARRRCGDSKIARPSPDERHRGPARLDLARRHIVQRGRPA